MTVDLVANQRDNGAWYIGVDGEDIANGVRELVIKAGGDRGPGPAHVTVYIDTKRLFFSGKANVEVDPVTKGVLCKLGWTPPKEET